MNPPPGSTTPPGTATPAAANPDAAPAGKTPVEPSRTGGTTLLEELREPRRPPPPPPPGGSSGSETGLPTRGQEVRREIEERLRDRQLFEEQGAGFGSPPKPDPPPYPVVGYRLDGPIGEGSFGSVWKARDAGGEDERVVAIKFFPRAQASARELGREPARLKRLTSEEGFVQLLDVNPNAEWPYFVMTYAAKSLHAELDARGPLPAAEAARLFTQLARTMANAHTKLGLCHCDLKPSNVLLAESGRPLVSDFGQSRLLDKEDREKRSSLGTPFYMPVEQADVGREVPDPRWDVYALGAIFYRMVNPAGLPPRKEGWEEGSESRATKRLEVQLSKYRDHLENAAPPTAHHRVRGVDGRLAAIVDRCLELKPERRYRDAGALLDALRARSAARRRAPVLRLAVLATLFGLLGAAAAGWEFKRHTDSGHQAQLAQQQKQVTSEVREGLGRMAYVVSQLLQDKLSRRVNFLERAVPDPKPGDRPDPAGPGPALEKALWLERDRHDMPLATRWLDDDRRAVDEWLGGVARRAREEKVFDHLALTVTVNVAGRAYLFAVVDRNPDAREDCRRNPWANKESLGMFGRDYSYRDWFSGRGYLTAGEAAKDPARPIDRTHISVLYRSTYQNNWVVDVTRPIRGTRPDPTTGRPPVVGVLGGGISVKQELVPWLQEAEATAGPEAGPEVGVGGASLIIVNDRGFLVWRRDLDERLRTLSEPGRSDEEAVRKTVENLYQDVKAYARWQERWPAGGSDDLFDDPWDDTPDTSGPRYIAERAAFYPLGDKARPWYVIAARSHEDALKPVNELKDTMASQGAGLLARGLYLLGGFGVVAAALWGGVLWVLRRAEGAADV